MSTVVGALSSSFSGTQEYMAMEKLGHVTGEQTRLQLAQLSVATAPDEAASERDFEWGLGLMIRGICGR